MRHFSLKYMLLVAVVSFFTLSCDSSNNDRPSLGTVTAEQAFDVKEGDIDEIEFFVDDVLKVAYQTKIVNFGSEQAPCLFPVRDKYEVLDENYRHIFFPLDRADFEKFVKETWIFIVGLRAGAQEEDNYTAFQHFKNFVTSSNIDPAIMIKLAQNSDLRTILQIVDEADREYRTRGSDEEPMPVNNILTYLYLNNIHPDDFMTISRETGLRPFELMGTLMAMTDDIESIRTKGVVKDVISIIRDTYETIMTIVNLVNDNKILEVSTATVSVLNTKDINLKNYVNSIKGRTSEYRYKYIGSELVIRVDYEYKATHPSFAGEYIKSIYVNPLVAKHKTGKVICNVTYANPVNYNTSAYPIAKVLGSCAIQVGDCCCVQKFSTLAFDMYGDKGIDIIKLR